MRLLKLLFACRHHNIGFPITMGRGRNSVTTVLCRECGQKLEYDWANMKQGKAHNEPVAVTLDWREA